jgi:hypothetical protein
MYGWNVCGDTFSITRTDGTPDTQGNAAAFLISGSGQCAEFTGQCAAIFATYVLSYSAVEFYSTFQAGPGSYNSTSYSTGGAAGAEIIIPQTPPDPIYSVGGTNTIDNSWYGAMTQQPTLPVGAVSVANTWLIPLEGTGDSGAIGITLLIDGGDGLAYSQDSLTLALP